MKKSDRYLKSILAGFAIGAVVTIPAIAMAIMSGGAGHGSYAFARAFFPLPMLATLLTNDTISALSISLALAQFPIYGAVIGFYTACGNAHSRVISIILLLHAIGAAICFAGAVPNFS